MTSHIKLIILVVLGVGLSRTAEAQIERRDFLIPGGAGRLHVREVRDHRNAKPRNLILLHGGGPGGVPSFDLPVAGYSLAEDFAKRGFRIFVMDVRGWGSSTKPREMDEPPQNSAPLVSTKEAADDIETVVGWVVRRTHEKTALLGWASGGHWACAYASRGPAALSAIILLNTLYSVNAPWELRPSMQNFAAKDIRVPVLIVRGELDFWSRPADLSALARDLVKSPKVHTVTIKGGTHYLFLDRPEHGRSQFVSEVLNFLT